MPSPTTEAAARAHGIDEWVDAKWIQNLMIGAVRDVPSLDWIRKNVPGRQKWSHRRVRWPRGVVVRWLMGQAFSDR